MMAPTMIWPPTSSVGVRFLAVTNWARPIVPPAPGMFTTWTLGDQLLVLKHLLDRAGMLVPTAARGCRRYDLKALDLGCRGAGEDRAGGQNRRGHHGFEKCESLAQHLALLPLIVLGHPYFRIWVAALLPC